MLIHISYGLLIGGLVYFTYKNYQENNQIKKDLQWTNELCSTLDMKIDLCKSMLEDKLNAFNNKFKHIQ